MRALVFSIDDNYVMPFKVLWRSLIDTKSIPLNTKVYILHEDALSGRSIECLTQFFEGGPAQVEFRDASSSVPNHLPISHHFSKATYYRLYISSILSVEFSSALYLDSDAVVARSMAPLFEVDLSAPIAACDHFSPGDGFRIWGEVGGSYFQAGVLLIDLDYWRKHHCEKMFEQILQEQRDRIQWWDQDVLNIAFKDQWQRLPIRYNLCSRARRCLGDEFIQEKGCYIHYDGGAKPWLRPSDSLASQVWHQAYAAVFGTAMERSQLKWPLAKRIRKRFSSLMKH